MSNDIAKTLKEEINKTLSDLHDFAKWKLIAVSSLAAAGLGLGSSVNSDVSVWLLLFVPFACAYIDLNCYQYLLRILLIAKVLREDSADGLLKTYEAECERHRKSGYFGLGLFAQAGSSFVFSIALPAVAIDRLATSIAPTSTMVLAGGIWVVGLCFIGVILIEYQRKQNLAESRDDMDGPEEQQGQGK